MTATLVRKTSVILWALVFSGMVISCSEPSHGPPLTPKANNATGAVDEDDTVETMEPIDRDAGPSEEIWRCFALSDRNKGTPLFSLFRSTSGNEAVDLIGMVFVAGTAHAAQFGIAGLDRRWDFDYNEGRGAFRYAFIIEPDGTGAYYDFSTSDDGTAKAKQIFRCQLSP